MQTQVYRFTLLYNAQISGNPQFHVDCELQESWKLEMQNLVSPKKEFKDAELED